MITIWRCSQALIHYAANDSAAKTKFIDVLKERKLS